MLMKRKGNKEEIMEEEDTITKGSVEMEMVYYYLHSCMCDRCRSYKLCNA